GGGAWRRRSVQGGTVRGARAAAQASPRVWRPPGASTSLARLPSPAMRRATSKPSAAQRRSSWIPAFLRHRNLMAAEAVLVIGLLKGAMEGWVKASDLPGWGKVAFIMGGTVGLLGGLYWLIE